MMGPRPCKTTGTSAITTMSGSAHSGRGREPQASQKPLFLGEYNELRTLSATWSTKLSECNRKKFQARLQAENQVLTEPNNHHSARQ